MTDVIDISVSLRNGMPVWPDSRGFRVDRTMSIADGDEANVSLLTCDVHAGTHVDAPHHFLEDGATVDQLSLDALIGPAYVASLDLVAAISASDLDELALPVGAKRLLLHTRNSQSWGQARTEFPESCVALDADAAQWIVGRGIRLVGIDGLSIQRYGDDPEVHRILLAAGVVVVEGLDLRGVEEGVYELICLPLKIAGAEGAPARVVLRWTGARERQNG